MGDHFKSLLAQHYSSERGLSELTDYLQAMQDTIPCPETNLSEEDQRDIFIQIAETVEDRSISRYELMTAIAASQGERIRHYATHGFVPREPSVLAKTVSTLGRIQDENYEHHGGLDKLNILLEGLFTKPKAAAYLALGAGYDIVNNALTPKLKRPYPTKVGDIIIEEAGRNISVGRVVRINERVRYVGYGSAYPDEKVHDHPCYVLKPLDYEISVEELKNWSPVSSLDSLRFVPLVCFKLFGDEIAPENEVKNNGNTRDLVSNPVFEYYTCGFLGEVSIDKFLLFSKIDYKGRPSLKASEIKFEDVRSGKISIRRYIPDLQEPGLVKKPF